MKRFSTTLLWLLASHTAPLTPADLPPTLRDWLPWAQQGQPPLGCPAQAEGETAHCVWPGRLQLNASARGDVPARRAGLRRAHPPGRGRPSRRASAQRVPSG
ncbi:hypothetical protein NYO99_13215 [Pelomonas sp. UHG3]|uniref:Uncharacterized protein n=1 Tax=Roseateles hydrophilus TaxID=2975054 RepID=A0ACC6CC09_9BURK|nr:hypothetical protein [Pelomonas sp. UHG3]MCY4745938.1 hypothetical protein [Pelomonas sp. UHG3]